MKVQKRVIFLVFIVIFLNTVLLSNVSASDYSKKVCLQPLVLERAALYLDTPNIRGKKLSLIKSSLVSQDSASCEYKIVGTNEYNELSCGVNIMNFRTSCSLVYNPNIVPRDRRGCEHPLITNEFRKFIPFNGYIERNIFNVIQTWNSPKVDGDSLRCFPSFQASRTQSPFVYTISGRLSCDYSFSKKNLNCQAETTNVYLEKFCKSSIEHILKEISVPENIKKWYKCDSLFHLKEICTTQLCNDLAKKYEDETDYFLKNHKILTIISADIRKIKEADETIKDYERKIKFRREEIHRTMKSAENYKERKLDYYYNDAIKTIQRLEGEVAKLESEKQNFIQELNQVKAIGIRFYCFFDPKVNQFEGCNIEK